jgi:hypothetical protein
MSDLAQAERALERAAHQENVWPDLRLFVDTIRELADDPQRLRTPEAEQFLRSTAPRLSDASLALGSLIHEAEGLVGQEFFGNEWLGVCERRTDIEWLRTLYRELLGEDIDFLLDVESLDDMIRQKGEHEGGNVAPDRIPKSVPASHWWWWYPKSPPEQR